MSAGTSPQGRRKPNGSACHRRIMAVVQDEAKHAIRAMSPLKSCDVKKPQPQRSERMGQLTSRHQADNHTSGRKRWRLAAFLLLGPCHGERTGVAHVVPCPIPAVIAGQLLCAALLMCLQAQGKGH
jgi:hypothetical protein